MVFFEDISGEVWWWGETAVLAEKAETANLYP